MTLKLLYSTTDFGVVVTRADPMYVTFGIVDRRPNMHGEVNRDTYTRECGFRDGDDSPGWWARWLGEERPTIETAARRAIAACNRKQEELEVSRAVREHAERAVESWAAVEQIAASL